MLSGPFPGNGPQDYFTPEINSTAIGCYPTGDWTTDNAATRQYDGYKVEAVLNWIRGFDHSGRHYVGIPAIFGMNFQTVSTAEKLPASDGLIGGYEPGAKVPGPLLQRALNYINTEVGKMVTTIRQRGTLEHRHHHLGQARPVPDQPGRPEAGPRLRHHRQQAAWAVTQVLPGIGG